MSGPQLPVVIQSSPRHYTAVAAAAPHCRHSTAPAHPVLLTAPYPTGGAGGGGLHVTDASNASRTNLMDLRSLSWHEPTLRLFGVPPAMLPQIRSNAEVYG